jgi:hypothetical protein
VQQGNSAVFRGSEIDGHAVGDGDQQQEAGRRGEVPVGAFEDVPAARRPLVPEQLGAVDLTRQDRSRKIGKRGVESPPPRHRLAYWLLT